MVEYDKPVVRCMHVLQIPWKQLKWKYSFAKSILRCVQKFSEEKWIFGTLDEKKFHTLGETKHITQKWPLLFSIWGERMQRIIAEVLFFWIILAGSFAEDMKTLEDELYVFQLSLYSELANSVVLAVIDNMTLHEAICVKCICHIYFSANFDQRKMIKIRNTKMTFYEFSGQVFVQVVRRKIFLGSEFEALPQKTKIVLKILPGFHAIFRKRRGFGAFWYGVNGSIECLQSRMLLWLRGCFVWEIGVIELKNWFSVTYARQFIKLFASSKFILQ